MVHAYVGNTGTSEARRTTSWLRAFYPKKLNKEYSVSKRALSEKKQNNTTSLKARVSRIPHQLRTELTLLFKYVDRDDSGAINAEEFEYLFAELGIGTNSSDMEQIFFMYVRVIGDVRASMKAGQGSVFGARGLARGGAQERRGARGGGEGGEERPRWRPLCELYVEVAHGGYVVLFDRRHPFSNVLHSAPPDIIASFLNATSRPITLSLPHPTPQGQQGHDVEQGIDRPHRAARRLRESD